MATGYTQHYGLCQWAGEDKFLREEFNGDNEKLDAAVKAASAGAALAAAGLEGLSYNVYNLMLQSYYDGKQTGHKKALLFDGFKDGGGIASKDAALALADGRLSLFRSIASETELPNGTAYLLHANWGNEATAAAVAAPGGALLHRIKIWWIAAFGKPSSQGSPVFTFYVNDVARHTQAFSLHYTAVEQSGYLTLSTPIPVGAGDRVHFTVAGIEADHVLAERNQLGGKLVYALFGLKPTNAAAGKVIMLAAALPTCQRMVGWVRHIGGAVSLAIQTDGVKRAMAGVDRRASVSLHGDACTEETFQLAGPLPAGSTAVVLDLALKSGDSGAALLDYGVVLL